MIGRGTKAQSEAMDTLEENGFRFAGKFHAPGTAHKMVVTMKKQVSSYEHRTASINHKGEVNGMTPSEYLEQ